MLVSDVLRTKELQIWFLIEHLVNLPLVVAKEAPEKAGVA